MGSMRGSGVGQSKVGSGISLIRGVELEVENRSGKVRVCRVRWSRGEKS